MRFLRSTGSAPTLRQTPFGSVDTSKARFVAGVLALIPTLAILLVRVGINIPHGQGVPFSSLTDLLVVAALLGPALGALIVSLTTNDESHQIALAFAGVFGLLSAVGKPAIVPASITIVFATGAIVGNHVRQTDGADGVAETLIGVAFVIAVALSMAGNLGIEGVTTRRLGSVVGLIAIAGTPVFVEWSRRSVFVGLVAGVVFGGVGLQAPFVIGAASLVAGGIVGVSLPVMALAVVGGVTLVGSGMERRTGEPVVAGLLFLSAGIPATVPRGLAVLVGLVVLLQSRTDP